MCPEEFTNMDLKHTKRNKIASFVGVCIQLLFILSIFFADFLNCIFEITFELHCNHRILNSLFSPASIARINKSYEHDDTQNPVSKILSWPQISDGVSCLSWWFAIFTGYFFVSRCGDKQLCLQQWNYIVKLQKNKFSHNLWYNRWRSVCSEMLGPSALQCYRPTKSWYIVLGTMGLYYALLIFSNFSNKLCVPYKPLNQRQGLKNTKPLIHQFVCYYFFVFY